MRSSSIFFRRYVWFIVLYAVAIGLYLWYTSPNIVPAMYKGSAADPSAFMTAEQLRQSEVYSAERSWLFFMSYPWTWGVYGVMLFGGGASRLQKWLERRAAPGWIRFPLFVAAVTFIAFVSYLPLRFIGFILSRSYGISTQPFVGWLRDKGVGYGVSAITTIAAASAAFWLIRRGGRWWLKLWLLSVPFTIFLMYIQPVLIDPLYDKFTRLSDPALEHKILQLAENAGVPADRVYEVHVSDKTNAMNAYVNGIGPTLRIVLWDTTLKRLNEDEILQIMGHEMGHYNMHHLEWSAAGAVISSFFFLWLGSALLRALISRWGRHWGIGKHYDYAVLPASLLLISVLTFVTLPFSNFVSRQAEQAADRFALRLIGNARGAVSMGQKLAVVTLDDVNPPMLVKWFQYDHPSDMERIIDAATYLDAAK